MRAQFDALRRWIKIAVAIGKPQTTLQQVRIVVFRVVKTLVDEQPEYVVSVADKSIDFGIQRGADVSGECLFAFYPGDVREIVCERGKALGLDRILVDE